MALADLLDRVPALGRLEWLFRSFAPRHRVVLAVEDNSLTLSWWQHGERQWRLEPLPADLCQHGLPQQRQALGELCADLLLDCGLSPVAVDLVLFLPLPACEWRLLTGADAQAMGALTAAQLRLLQPSLDWPLRFDDSYLSLMPLPLSEPAQVVVGAPRPMLQAWVDVVEAADLSLQRMDWLLAAAWRGLRAALDPLPAELVWLIRCSQGWRLVLLSQGMPELDRWLSDQELASDQGQDKALQVAVESTLAAWETSPDGKGGASRWERHWWITASAPDQERWLSWLARAAEGPVLGRQLGEGSELGVNPLVSLAQAGGDGLDLLEERRPELGMPAATPVVPESRSLLLLGSGWAGALLLLGGIGWGGMAWWEAYQAQQLDALVPVEQRVLATEAQLRRLKARTATLSRDNKQIAQQLVAVRSGSALLEQLRRVTPQGVQLQDLSVTGDAIKLTGSVQTGGRPGALERINALVLALAALPETKADGVKVVKATRADKGDVAQLRFSLTWTLDPAVKPSLAQLEALGAEGMAERLRLLQQQGVQL